MAKYVVVEFQKSVRLIESDKASYIPAGWHKPYKFYTLDNLGKAKTHPSQKRGALIQVPGLTTHSNNVRLVSEDTCKEIDEIDAQILELRKRRQSIIYDKFRTFPLVQEGDIKTSQFEKVFATKQEAEGK